MDVENAARPAVGVWVVAPFDATGSTPPGGRSAPLTWGQRALWMALRRRGAEQATISLRRTVPVPRRAAADVPSVLRALGDLIVRHDSLRTRVRLVDGELTQLASVHGALPVLVIHAGDNRCDPETISQAASTAMEQLAGSVFDHAEDWPQRVALVVAGDQVRQIVVVFSHTTVDFQAVEIVLRDLRMLLVRGSISTPAGLQSIDVARREDAEHHRRRGQRVVRHWLDGFGRLPGDTIAYAGPPLQPRFQRGVLMSVAADTATRMIANRHRMTSSTVLLTATAAVLAHWARDNPGATQTGSIGIHTMSNNRSHDGYRDAIAKLNQLGLVVVDVADRPDFAELLPRVWRAALEAYRYAYYDPTLIADAFEQAGFPYNTGVSPHCYLNDIRLSTDTDLFGRATGEAEVRAALTTSTMDWTGGLANFTWRTRVEVLDAPGALGLALTADTGHLPPEAIERFLRDLERLLVEAAFREVPWPWL